MTYRNRGFLTQARSLWVGHSYWVALFQEVTQGFDLEAVQFQHTASTDAAKGEGRKGWDTLAFNFLPLSAWKTVISIQSPWVRIFREQDLFWERYLPLSHAHVSFQPQLKGHLLLPPSMENKLLPPLYGSTVLWYTFHQPIARPKCFKFEPS